MAAQFEQPSADAARVRLPRTMQGRNVPLQKAGPVERLFAHVTHVLADRPIVAVHQHVVAQPRRIPEALVTVEALELLAVGGHEVRAPLVSVQLLDRLEEAAAPVADDGHTSVLLLNIAGSCSTVYGHAMSAQACDVLEDLAAAQALVRRTARMELAVLVHETDTTEDLATFALHVAAHLMLVLVVAARNGHVGQMHGAQVALRLEIPRNKCAVADQQRRTGRAWCCGWLVGDMHCQFRRIFVGIIVAL